jgi:hypothetical protein
MAKVLGGSVQVCLRLNVDYQLSLHRHDYLDDPEQVRTVIDLLKI